LYKVSEENYPLQDPEVWQSDLTGLAARENGVATRIEPKPVQNQHPATWDLVMADMRARDEFGAKKYNTRLQPHNGRDQLADAYQEALDLVVYLRNEIYERDGK
jgi:hypothetical protein